MKLKSFGCSFIFGSDLADDGRDGPYPTPSQFTWPALIAKKLNLNYECYARPGSGNLQILEKVLTQAATEEPSVFVIGWSWTDRFDHYDAYWNRFSPSMSPWKTIMPVDNTELAETYYRELHSEYQDKLTSLTYIKTAVDILKQKNISFVMTYMDRLLFDQRCHVTPAIAGLQNYIQPHMNLFEDQTFLEWSKSKGFEITAQAHPLEAAHLAAAEYMIKIFDKQNIIDR